MDQKTLDALDNYRIRMVKEGAELLNEHNNKETRKIIRASLIDMANKINNPAQRTLAFKLIGKERK